MKTRYSDSNPVQRQHHARKHPASTLVGVSDVSHLLQATAPRLFSDIGKTSASSARLLLATRSTVGATPHPGSRECPSPGVLESVPPRHPSARQSRESTAAVRPPEPTLPSPEIQKLPARIVTQHGVGRTNFNPVRKATRPGPHNCRRIGSQEFIPHFVGNQNASVQLLEGVDRIDPNQVVSGLVSATTSITSLRVCGEVHARAPRLPKCRQARPRDP
jgi:hypothetical protein